MGQIDTPRPAPILVVGSLSMDLVARCPRLPAPGETAPGSGFALHPGGKGANAATAARLAAPAVGKGGGTAVGKGGETEAPATPVAPVAPVASNRL